MTNNNTILKIENLSKQYRLGVVGTGTISHDLNRWWHKVRGKEDPFLKIGETNDRTTKSNSKYVWALKDINFEVQEGEVLGIIGKNGAGKSTLLKILSRVTGPTTGSIKSRGRIASLLEVGTGFHPELTGKENIFLNGAILGMTKAEINAKLDEIVDFSGVARYLDTPVKRYSSGMKVRLAFAVAAHLEPDILVVDEVLAVGDAEFQKKAIGKMQDISKGQGRTVLFVSHNMAAVKSLCSKAIVLENGKITFSGLTDESVDYYLKEKGSINGVQYIFSSEDNTSLDLFQLIESGVRSDEKKYGDPIYRKDKLLVETIIDIKKSATLGLVYRFKDNEGSYLFVSGKELNMDSTFIGKSKISMFIPSSFFNEGSFFLDILISDGKKILFLEEDIIQFTVIHEKIKLGKWMGKTKGPLKPDFNWSIKPLLN